MSLVFQTRINTNQPVLLQKKATSAWNFLYKKIDCTILYTIAWNFLYKKMDCTILDAQLIRVFFFSHGAAHIICYIETSQE